MEKIRLLRADEIDCRPQTVKAGGCSLLLYKDARCDMAMKITIAVFHFLSRCQNGIKDGQDLSGLNITANGCWCVNPVIGTKKYLLTKHNN